MIKELTGNNKVYFDLCFGNDKLISENILGNYIKAFPNYNYEEFKRITFKTEIEPYTALLWMYIAFNENNIKAQRPISIVEKNIKTIKNNIDLIQALLFFFEADIEQTTCTLKDAKNTCKITSCVYIEDIKSSLLKRFKETGLQFSKYTFDEAKEILLNKRDITWIQQYCKQRITDYEFSTSESEEINWENPKEYVTNDIIEDYAYSHTIEREISRELLLDRLQCLKNRLRTKPGARRKNNRVAKLAIRLYYLANLEKFIFSNKENDISKMKLRNSHCRLIYEYLRHFNLIDDIDSQQNSTTPESYIKALINNYYKQANANKDYAKDRINSYKLNNKEFSPF